MEIAVGRFVRLGICLCWLNPLLSRAQQHIENVDIPSQFTVDLQTAARLRPQLIAQSVAPSGRYVRGSLVFKTLIQQELSTSSRRLDWALRIVEGGGFNAYSSPDGAIFVESGLADLAGTNPGLWAALLSHEIAHALRRDWARRYLFEKRLRNEGGATIVLGDPGLASSWMDSRTASSELAGFCRKLEVEADRESLTLMVRAGYHPDFVPALHHLLQAHVENFASRSAYPMHPCWEERDRELNRAYIEASIAFERRWPDWNASPGGNPPTLVFAERPVLRRTGAKEWEISFPLRCQNLAGAVEVVLLPQSGKAKRRDLARLSDSPDSKEEIREVTGCTSPTTTISFRLTDSENSRRAAFQGTQIYVVDAWGSLLARTDIHRPE